MASRARSEFSRGWAAARGGSEDMTTVSPSVFVGRGHDGRGAMGDVGTRGRAVEAEGRRGEGMRLSGFGFWVL
ncbi:hypothetical protein NL676_039288 [Syzygium grande]|nr:hypothetical protein NL676_039288 [Syzygium grande]